MQTQLWKLHIFFYMMVELSSMKDILPLLEQVSHQNKSLVIIADDLEGEALRYIGSK